jgi:basic membrane protein A
VLALAAALLGAAALRGPGEAAAPEEGRKRVAVVLSVGGLGDRSFNDMAYEGLVRARDEIGVIGAYGEPAAMSEDERYLDFYAEQGFDLVFAVGFLMTSSLEKVAPRHPDTRFAIIDSVVDAPNVASLVFREHEGSYLVGALAARKSESGVIGIVKGLDVPLLMKFEHGYRQGFDAERKHLGLPPGRVLSMVAGSFADPVRGKELTRVLHQEGADVVFQAAGQTGNGVIAGAKEAGIYAIGVDANQNHERPGTVLTSMIKKVDVAVFETTRAVVEGRFRAGVQAFGVADGGVGWALDEHNRDLVSVEDESRLRELEQRIASGELQVEELPREDGE